VESIRQGTCRCLRDDAGDSTSGKRNPNRLLIPARCREINRQKGTDAALHIG
jgi:hypothetical protein